MAIKQFTLTLLQREENPEEKLSPKILFEETIEGEDLVELMTKLLLMIAQLQRELAKKIPDDDIPF